MQALTPPSPLCTAHALHFHRENASFSPFFPRRPASNCPWGERTNYKYTHRTNYKLLSAGRYFLLAYLPDDYLFFSSAFKNFLFTIFVLARWLLSFSRELVRGTDACSAVFSLPFSLRHPRVEATHAYVQKGRFIVKNTTPKQSRRGPL